MTKGAVCEKLLLSYLMCFSILGRSLHGPLFENICCPPWGSDQYHPERQLYSDETGSRMRFPAWDGILKDHCGTVCRDEIRRHVLLHR